MKNKLYVGNIPYSLTDETLSQLFSEVGEVVSARVIMDRDTGRSKGFGFVEMESDEAAANAAENLNGREMNGRAIRVDLAREREGRPGGGGGGGGYGRGGRR